MAFQLQVKTCRPRGPVNPHIVVKCKWLRVLVPVRFVASLIISESLNNFLIEPLGLPVCLQRLGGGRIVFGVQYSANGVKELDKELLPAVG